MRYCHNCDHEIQQIASTYVTGWIYWCSRCGTLDSEHSQPSVPTFSKYYNQFKEFIKEIVK